LKLLKVSQGIRSLLETIACALPQVGNLGMLFALLFFIFAALGVELFGTLSKSLLQSMYILPQVWFDFVASVSFKVAL